MRSEGKRDGTMVLRSHSKNEYYYWYSFRRPWNDLREHPVLSTNTNVVDNGEEQFFDRF
jgi:hypothetical protein